MQKDRRIGFWGFFKGLSEWAQILTGFTKFYTKQILKISAVYLLWNLKICQDPQTRSKVIRFFLHIFEKDSFCWYKCAQICATNEKKSRCKIDQVSILYYNLNAWPWTPILTDTIGIWNVICIYIKYYKHLAYILAREMGFGVK